MKPVGRRSPLAGVGRMLKRLRADRRGATAVEFAIVVVPFLILVFGILELALVFMVNISLDVATATEARKFRTGQECLNGSTAQTQAAGVQALKQDICNNMTWLQAQCMDNLAVDIRSFSTYSGASAPPPPTSTNAQGQTVYNPSQVQDKPGGSGSINIITSYYAWPLLTPAFYNGLETIPGSGQHLVVSTQVMSFEPFGTCTQYLGQ